MGWTYFYDGRKTPDIIRAEFHRAPVPGERTGFEIIDHAMYGSTWYGIIKVTPQGTGQTPEPEPYHVGAVILTKRVRGEFGYKDMDENMGPYHTDCPARILDALDRLSPAPSANAFEWRSKCRARLASKAAKRAYAPGMVVTYGGKDYRLVRPAGARKGWDVLCPDNWNYRMTARQLSAAILTSV